MTNNEGKTWQSNRILDKENYQCIADREEPKFPFKYMHIKWIYEEVLQGTKMLWIQDFEMNPEAGYSDEKAEQLINQHSKDNMEKIKKIIEAGDLY